MWPGDAETSCAHECNWIFISIVFIAIFVFVFIVINIIPGIVIYVMSQSLSILTAIIQVNLG